MIRVMIVDDQEMIRVGLTAVLDSFEDLEVVAVAADGLSAIEMLRDVAPEVVLMDIRMPGIDGIEATRRMRAAAPEVQVVMLTTFEQDENVIAALQAGASGFLNKGVGPQELAEGVRGVIAGGGALTATAAATVIGRVVDAPPPSDPALRARFEALTPRELEIVEAIALGGSNEEIAKSLFLSPFTVKTHANRAMAKVSARDRGQLVTFAFRAGLVR